MEKLLEILLSVAGAIIASISALICFLINRWKKKVEARDKEIEQAKQERKVLVQDYNFTGGAVESMRNQLKSKKSNGEYSISIDPDIRECWIETCDILVEKYHSHDLIKK